MSALRHVSRRSLLWLAAPLLLVSCDFSLGPRNDREEQFEIHRERWQRRGFDSYDLTLRVFCFCPPIGAARVEVRGGVRIAVVEAESGEPFPANVARDFPDVPGLFAIIRDAIDRNAHRLEVIYDQALGVPLRIEIDYSRNTIDEEVTWVVDGLVRR